MKKPLTYHPWLPFRQCGFEFTAEKRANFKYPVIEEQKSRYTYWNRGDRYGLSRFSDHSAGFWEKYLDKTDLNDACAYEIYELGKHYKESPEWMQKKSHDDSCLECPTPIVRKRSEIVKYFLEFERWTKLCGLTLDREKAEEALGGCHIHISVAGLGRSKRLFFRNLINFVTNYPELNWAFNDPNDVDNANSLLQLQANPYLSGLRVRFAQRAEARRELRRIAREDRNRHRRSRGSRILSDGTLQVTIQNHSAETTMMRLQGIPEEQREDFVRVFNGPDGFNPDADFDPDVRHRELEDQANKKEAERVNTNYYEMAIISPQSTSKSGAINFNSDYNTVEFRIFDQPRNLTEHLLHAEVAQRIFDYCFKKAQKKEAIELNIGPSFFKKLNQEKSIARFIECMKTIKIDPSRCSMKTDNICQRFDWNRQDPKYGYLK